MALKKHWLIWTILGSCALGTAASAADFSDPTWPCIQRKVESLSIGIMWPHPIEEKDLPEAVAKDAGDLIEALSLRRVSMEDAEVLVEKFAEQHTDLTTADYGLIFQGVFERIVAARTAIMSGIARYSLKQIALSKAVDETRLAMSNHMKAENPDYDEVDRLEEKLDWDERIYRDRAQSLTYVCETPVLLEKRAYGIAQILLKHVE